MSPPPHGFPKLSGPVTPQPGKPLQSTLVLRLPDNKAAVNRESPGVADDLGIVLPLRELVLAGDG
jgi:hypothetical protein